MIKSSSFLGILLLSFGAGCSSSGGSSSVPIGALGSEFSEAACDYFAECPVPGVAGATFALLARNPGSAGTCGDLLEQAFGGFGAYEAAVDRGTVIYDGAAAARCLAALSDECLPPEALLAVEPRCLDVFTGTVAAGGGCLLDEECTGGARCVPTNASGCAGTCVAPGGIGASCTDDEECSAELGGTMECTTTAANAADHCVITRYVVAGPGDQCGETDVDGDEQVTAYCRSGLYCKLATLATVGTCSNPIGVGMPCNEFTDACVEGTACGGTGSKTCRSISLIEDAGVACDPASLIVCNPLDRLECQDSVCAVIGNGTAGQPCRATFGVDCNAGLYCDPKLAGSTCESLGSLGEPCGAIGNGSCDTGYCDESDALNPVCAAAICL